MTTNSEHLTRYKSRFVKSADGTEIYSDAVGYRSPGFPSIVLIHGASMVKNAFDPIFEDPKWTCTTFLVRYDGRGHGRSGKPLSEEAWESKRFAEDFEAVCNEFEVKEAYVLGWSVGSAQFVDITAYNTSVKISGFINVAGAISLDPVMSQRTAKPEVFECLGALTNPPSAEAFQEAILNFIHLCSDELSPDLFRVLFEGMILQPREVISKINGRKQNPERMLQEARDGRLPLLAIGGGKDKLLNTGGFKAIFEELGWKRCTYKHLGEADHLPWVSCPPEFRETVLEWVKDQSR